jgi:hypothetical protein
MSVRRRVLAVVLLGCVAAWLALQWLEWYWDEKPYSLVEDRLYLGGTVARPPPGTRAVLNLCDREDPYQIDISLWEPIDGSRAPDLDWLRRVVTFIDTQRRAGNPTYVHCQAGMNRSGMVVTAYLMWEHDWTRDQALAFARSKRPQVQPNATMMRLLAEWEQALQDRGAGGK